MTAWVSYLWLLFAVYATSILLFGAIVVGAIVLSASEGRGNRTLDTVGGNINGQFLCKLCDVKFFGANRVSVFGLAKKINVLSAECDFFQIALKHSTACTELGKNLSFPFRRNYVSKNIRFSANQQVKRFLLGYIPLNTIDDKGKAGGSRVAVIADLEAKIVIAGSRCPPICVEIHDSSAGRYRDVVLFWQQYRLVCS